MSSLLHLCTGGGTSFALVCFFFFNDTATTEIYTLSLHDALPIASTFAFGNTGTKLKVKFGRDGLLVWVCFLAACKKNWIQGQFEYTSEPDGWNRLGLYGYQPDFTLKEF